LRHGISRERYWTLTPREFSEELDAASWRDREAWKRCAYQAWQTAALTWQKKLPPLKDVLAPFTEDRPTGEDAAKKRAEQDRLAARAWSTVLAQIGEAQERAAAKAKG
jgi:hypothetical protein